MPREQPILVTGRSATWAARVGRSSNRSVTRNPRRVLPALSHSETASENSQPGRGLKPLLLAREELLDVLAAELRTFHDGVADTREHFPEPQADLTPPDLLGASLDPLGRLIHLGLVGRDGCPR